jgi:hypothetical protein
MAVHHVCFDRPGHVRAQHVDELLPHPLPGIALIDVRPRRAPTSRTAPAAPTQRPRARCRPQGPRSERPIKGPRTRTSPRRHRPRSSARRHPCPSVPPLLRLSAPDRSSLRLHAVRGITTPREMLLRAHDGRRCASFRDALPSRVRNIRTSCRESRCRAVRSPATLKE